MEFTTTVKEFPTQVQRHHLSVDAEIRVIVEAKQAEQKSPYIQIGDKAAFEEFKNLFESHLILFNIKPIIAT